MSVKNTNKILITGGAGFIGANLANYFAKKGCTIHIFDNLSRRGTKENLKWLTQKHSSKIIPQIYDLRFNQAKLNELAKAVDRIYHLAGQVAVTASVKNPREDFEINALGTFNLLEAIRQSGNNPILIYSSTNKVYGGMTEIKIIEKNGRYAYQNVASGIEENRLLDFHSPYGCSKGAADQYVRDYARIYGLQAVVFRQSCIYGPRQFGIEDQGWVAWFTIAALLDKPLVIYGDGKQVRDILYIDDLIRAFDLASEKIDQTKGKIYNIGGGSDNTMSLLELVAFLEKFSNKKIKPKFSDWRPGDQPIYISNISKASEEFGWWPKLSPSDGVKKLAEWVKENQKLFKDF